jgi:HEPN domain-containing protein
MNSRPEAWLHQARNDLALARLAREHGFLAQACYHASQAAEKALKGALLELGIEPPHTHVLNDLVRLLSDAGIETGALNDLPLRGLSRMAIQSRYPMDATPPSDLFDPVDADQALKTANGVLSTLEALDQPNHS